MNLEAALYKYFKYSSFRSIQKQIIEHILEQPETIALLPTGAGKSICFQLPALLLPGMTVVISPLIALMQDQVDSLISKGISATYISSSLSKTEVTARINLLQLHKYKLLYISPERLQHKKFARLLKKLPLTLLVIDEAHCISEWGHDFRPEYMQIGRFINSLSMPPKIAAFTATATSKTLLDIKQSLRMSAPQVFRTSFARKNLKISVYSVSSTQQQEAAVLFLLQKHQQQSGIIYCATRKSTEYLTKLLKKYFPNLATECYHAGLSPKERSYIQQLFMYDKLQVIVATSAFGMGVDKSNISFVIHFHFPASIEAYYQEIGRAGRGGTDGYCYLIYNLNNKVIHESLSQEKAVRVHADLRNSRLAQMIAYAQSSKCRTQLVLQYFSEAVTECCMTCDNCTTASPHTKTYLSKLLSTQQQLELANLNTYRKYLHYQHKLEDPCMVLTDGQMIQILILQPNKVTDLHGFPGFGDGWMSQWKEHFSIINGKIPTAKSCKRHS